MVLYTIVQKITIACITYNLQNNAEIAITVEITLLLNK